jgi:hypothetical protein
MLVKSKTPFIQNIQLSKINKNINPIIKTSSQKSLENKKVKKEILKTQKKTFSNLKKEIKRKNSKSIIKENKNQKKNNNNNNNNHNQNICSSNCILPTNYTESKDDEKKIKKTFIETENNSKNEEMNLYYLGNLFRTSNLKRTIVIDENGNNNLNMKKEFLDYENINKKKRSSLPIKNSFQPFTHKKLESDNICLLNNLENKNKLINEEDELRLKEYGMIFNLLNNNIEEMKNMFNSQKELKDKKENKKEITLNNTDSKNQFQDYFNNKILNPSSYNYFHYKLFDTNGEDVTKLNSYNKNINKIRLFPEEMDDSFEKNKKSNSNNSIKSNKTNTLSSEEIEVSSELNEKNDNNSNTENIFGPDRNKKEKSRSSGYSNDSYKPY